MMKRLLLAAMVLIGLGSMKAQMDQPLPLNPEVKHGKLPNGLSYYILHNEEPKNRANFYIAQKVGSTLETPEQLGLAHFLEHMAFNGTEHYPGKNMLNYLQSKGIRFGADINAYTGFDETVYNINNVSTTDQALMDSVLLVLYDWSGSILLEEDEINAERGVIENEYVSRNNAQYRYMEAVLPQLYEEYQYEQLPIGKMEVVKNFPPQALKDYYKKWYRPDQQGIVIVGDFDAAEMEQKVIALFSQIPMPENAAERVYAQVSDNVAPIYVTFEDPEMRSMQMDLHFKFDRTPFEYRNTFGAYLADDLIAEMVSTMINNRLSEEAKNPDCPYSYAVVRVGTYVVSNEKGSFDVIVLPKENYEAALAAALGVVTRACKTGFMGTEVQRVRDEMIANYEKSYNEKDKTNSETLGRELIRHFIENEPSPGIEMEYTMVSQILPQINEQLLNQYAETLIHPENIAAVLSQPSNMGLVFPQEAEFVASLNNVLNAEYTPYVDEVITEPLISKLPKPGKIVKTERNSVYDGDVFSLSNGMKVIVKPTDFSNDEVTFQMFKEGGKRSYAPSQAADVEGLDFVLAVSNTGPFNSTRLQKYLAGKRVNVGYEVGNYTNYFTGNSTKKDLSTMFELLYASFTNVTKDEETFNALVAQAKAVYANQESNPEFIWQLRYTKDLYPDNPILWPITLSTIEALNYDNIFKLYKESVKNAADYTLIIVGNVDVATLKPLLEQYVATLPSTGKKTKVADKSSLAVAQGKVTDVFDIPAQNPAVFIYTDISQGGMTFDVKKSLMIELLGNILSNKFTETLREEMGGAYSPYARGRLNAALSTWEIVWVVGTTEDMQEAIRARAFAEFNKLLEEGADAENFTKVREAALSQYDNNVRTNSFWSSNILSYERGYDNLTGRREAIVNLTLDEFNDFIKNIYNGENCIEVVGIAK